MQIFFDIKQPDWEDFADSNLIRVESIDNKDSGGNYLISTPEQLAGAFLHPDNVTGSKAVYKLTKNLDMSGATWSSPNNNAIIDGQGFVIKNLNITGQGFVTNNYGTIKNINFRDITINTSENVFGTIVCWNYGELNSITLKSVKNELKLGYLGGMVWHNVKSKSVVKGCMNYADFNSNVCVSGIVGVNEGTVEFCFNHGKITGSNYVAGIVEENRTNAVLKRCINVGNIESGSCIGGICSQNLGTLTECGNQGTIQNILVNNSYTGGIAGKSSTALTDCYNTGNIIAGEVINNSIAYENKDTTLESKNVTLKNTVPMAARSFSNKYRIYISANSLSVGNSINPYNFNIGGIVGEGTSLKNCYSSGSVTSEKFKGRVFNKVSIRAKITRQILSKSSHKLARVKSTSYKYLDYKYNLVTGNAVDNISTTLNSCTNCFYTNKIENSYEDTKVTVSCNSTKTISTGYSTALFQSCISLPYNKYADLEAISSISRNKEAVSFSLSAKITGTCSYGNIGANLSSIGVDFKGDYKDLSWLKSSFISQINGSSVWGVDENINQGLPFLKNMYWFYSK